MSFSEPGKFFENRPGDSFQGRPGDAFQGRPGDSFEAGAFKSRSAERSAESHARHERWKQEKAAKVAEEAYENAVTNMAKMAKNNAEAFAAAAAQFRAMMELCYPDLVKLCNQKEIPDCTELFPAVSCLTPDGPGWMHPIPKGEVDGQALVWSEDEMAWLPGEVAAGAYKGEFALIDETDYSGSSTPSLFALKIAGGDVCVNGHRFTLQDVHKSVSISPGHEETYYLIVEDTYDEEQDRHDWTVKIDDTTEDAVGYLKLGSVVRNSNSDETNPGAYRIEQAYLGGTGSNIVVTEDCYS